MVTQVPEERNITKQELWKRIDRAFDVINDKKAEYDYQLSAARETATKAVSDITAKAQQASERSREAFQSALVDAKKTLEKLVAEAVTDVKRSLNNHAAETDKRTSNVMTKISEEVEIAIERRLSRYQGTADRIGEDVRDMKTSINGAISQFQVEARAKISALNSRMDYILSKFKMIARELS
jgi:exonuclease VII large subunit